MRAIEQMQMLVFGSEPAPSDAAAVDIEHVATPREAMLSKLLDSDEAVPKATANTDSQATAAAAEVAMPTPGVPTLVQHWTCEVSVISF